MALYRTALRVATLEALRPTALLKSQGPWPTLAQERVFDSRIDPIEDLTKDQHKASIVVYTQGDIGYGSQYRGGPPFRRVVDLCFEISQIASAPSEADPAIYEVGVPQTDRELEAELDRIESEISYALFYAPAGKLWRKLTGSMVSEPRSTAHRDSEEGARLAMRSLDWKVQCPDDLFELFPAAELVGPDRLPEPLKGIVKELRQGAYGRALAVALGETMPGAPPATALTDVTLGVEIVKPFATARGEANLNGDAPLTGYPPPPAETPTTDSNPG